MKKKWVVRADHQKIKRMFDVRLGLPFFEVTTLNSRALRVYYELNDKVSKKAAKQIVHSINKGAIVVATAQRARDGENYWCLDR